MLSFLLLAQLLALPPAAPARLRGLPPVRPAGCCAAQAPATPDSAYATAGLRALVAAVARSNRDIPAGFLSYTARVETEISVLARDTLGREHAADLEQLATRATWSRDGAYDLRVLGYRARTRGSVLSALSLVDGFTVPWLYGDRLYFGVGSRRRARRKKKPSARDTMTFVHPFSASRDDYYRFTGGDTVGMIELDGRRIPVARIVASPRPREQRFGAFDGDIYVDAERAQIVRMRGRLVTVGARGTGHATLVRLPGVVGVAYVDFRNAEVDGRYWLPAWQRTEFQATVAPLGGDARGIFRLVSTFRDYRVRDTTLMADSVPAPAVRMKLSYAPADSVDGFHGWAMPLGRATTRVHADDFADIAPDAWRADGPPRLVFYPRTLAEDFRFNRVEGLYLGVSGTLDLRSAVPGVSAGAFGGVATAERTGRGGAWVALRHAGWIVRLQAERALASTNDFVPSMRADPGFAALLGSVDNADYVDRRTATVSVTRVLGSVQTALATVELGAGRDGAEQTRITHGLFGGRSHGFGPNRGVLEGGYARAAAQLEVHPDVNGESLDPGIGARLRWEGAAGTLSWQRAELALSAHTYQGPLTLSAHTDAGLVWGGTIPPQQLFELGGGRTLPGYAWKEFAGDRAALFRGLAIYRLPLLSRPVHVRKQLYLPAVAPGLLVGVQGGWAEQSSAAARLAVARLGTLGEPPVSVPTDGVRATVEAGLGLFSGLVHIALARPVDHAASWKLVVGFGTRF